MPADYLIDRGLGCVFWVFDGVVTPEERDAGEARVLADPDLPHHARILVDARTMLGAEAFTSDDISGVADRWRHRGLGAGHARIALIVDKAWAPASEFSDRLENRYISAIVFNDLAGATSWLGIPRDAASEVVTQLRSDIQRRD